MNNSLPHTLGRRPDQPHEYFPALDGLRGLMAIGVVFAHVNMRWFPGATIMMDIFFVISGFLITLILMKNVQRNGNLQLLRFWRRRIRRLYPVLLLVITVYLPIPILLQRDSPMIYIEEAISALFYYSNWTKIREEIMLFPSYFGHTWSLSIEEQFYVLWPLLLWTAIKFNLNNRRIVFLFALLIAAQILWRNWLIHHGAIWSRLYFGLDTRMDAFLSGGILALAWDVWHEKWYRHRIFMVAMHICAALLLAAVLYWNPNANYRTYFAWQQSIVLLLSCATILALSAPSNHYLKSFFSLAPLRRLGLMCYSIYLWHAPLVWLLLWYEGTGDIRFKFTSHTEYINLAIVFMITLPLSHLSYHYLEAPILSKRIRYV